MILTPFYTKLVVKDYDFPDTWTDELILTLKYISLLKDDYCTLTKNFNNQDKAKLAKFDNQKLSKPYVINEETASEYSIIKQLREIFIDGFCELNREYSNIYDDRYLKEIYLNDSGNFAVLKSGDRVGLHNHPSIAFAIFYLTDVDNKTDGGELVLYDPSFNQQRYFSPSNEIKIPTKKNRLIIGPANVWHEVTPYYGNSERLCAVIDLKR